MEVLKFIATILLVVILACFAIFMISLVVYGAWTIIDDLRWEQKHRRK